MVGVGRSLSGMAGHRRTRERRAAALPAKVPASLVRAALRPDVPAALEAGAGAAISALALLVAKSKRAGRKLEEGGLGPPLSTEELDQVVRIMRTLAELQGAIEDAGRRLAGAAVDGMTDDVLLAELESTVRETKERMRRRAAGFIVPQPQVESDEPADPS